MGALIEIKKVDCPILNKKVTIQVNFISMEKPKHIFEGGMTDCYCKSECNLGENWPKECPIREVKYPFRMVRHSDPKSDYQNYR